MTKAEHIIEVEKIRLKYKSDNAKYNAMKDYLYLAEFEGHISQNDSKEIEELY